MITARTQLHPRGFSFVEILFAIAILGVGFIMIAGVFPVAIQQTKLTQEEASAQVIAQNANALMSATFASGVPQNTPPHTAGGWNWNMQHFLADINASRISTSDARYAWIPLYQYKNTAPASVQFVPIVIQSRNTPTFTGDGDTTKTAQLLNHLVPVQCKVAVVAGGGTNGVPRIYFQKSEYEGNNPALDQAVAEGGVVALKDGTTQILRIGLKIQDDFNGFSVWDAEPGTTLSTSYGVAPPDPGAAGVDAWLIGRGLADPAQPYDDVANPFEGPSMVIGVGDSKSIAY